MYHFSFLAYMMGGVQEMDFRPLMKLACSCEHISGARHRFALLDTFALVRALGGPGLSVVPLGGVRMGRFGLVLMGHAATDMWAVMNNVIWEDEHCNVCCGALLRFTEVFDQRALLRCGPTIGAEWNATNVLSKMAEDARRITDEYWTD